MTSFASMRAYDESAWQNFVDCILVGKFDEEYD